MKKTLIALLALSGVVSAAEYTYKTSAEGWVEVKGNWQGAGGAQVEDDGGWTNTNGHTFNINNGQIVKAGGHTDLNGGTFKVSGSNSTLRLDNNGDTYTPTQVDVTESGTFEVGSGTTLGTTTSKPVINIEDTGSLKVSGNAQNAKVNLKSGSSTEVFSGGRLTIGNTTSSDGTKIGDADIVVNAGGLLTIGWDVKMKDTTITTSAVVNIKKTWWDGSTDNGPITFDLKDSGKVEYDHLVYRTAGNSPWSGSLTLSANCSEGFLEGSGLELHERELVSFGQLEAKDNSTVAELAGKLYGGAITLNGVTLDAAQAAFDDANLSAADVGKYNLVLQEVAGTDDYVIKVQYVAYSSQSVPEPATATLSLLALCGLAARRRRK